MKKSLYLAIWNALCLAMLGIGYGYGLIQAIFLRDLTHLTAVIALVMLGVLVYTTYSGYRMDRGDNPEPLFHFPDFVRTYVLLSLGLIGTLIGLIGVISKMSAGSADADAIIAAMASMSASMSTAFNVTLVALAAKLWTDTIVYLQERAHA